MKKKKTKNKDKIKALIKKGKKKGFLSYEEMDAALPQSIIDPEEIDDFYQKLDDLDIAIEKPVSLKDHEAERKKILSEETKNPLQAYLEEVGETSLLTPTEEVNLAKSIDEAEKELRNVIRKKSSRKTIRNREKSWRW